MWLWLGGYGKAAGTVPGRAQASLRLFHGGRVHAPHCNVIAILRAIGGEINAHMRQLGSSRTKNCRFAQKNIPRLENFLFPSKSYLLRNSTLLKNVLKTEKKSISLRKPCSVLAGN